MARALPGKAVKAQSRDFQQLGSSTIDFVGKVVRSHQRYPIPRVKFYISFYKCMLYDTSFRYHARALSAMIFF